MEREKTSNLCQCLVVFTLFAYAEEVAIKAHLFSYQIDCRFSAEVYFSWHFYCCRCDTNADYKDEIVFWARLIMSSPSTLRIFLTSGTKIIQQFSIVFRWRSLARHEAIDGKLRELVVCLVIVAIDFVLAFARMSFFTGRHNSLENKTQLELHGNQVEFPLNLQENEYSRYPGTKSRHYSPFKRNGNDFAAMLFARSSKRLIENWK